MGALRNGARDRMYVGRKYTATQTKGFDMLFACPRCRFESDVHVIAVGQGAGASPYFLDEEGARERAHAAAARAVVKKKRKPESSASE